MSSVPRALVVGESLVDIAYGPDGVAVHPGGSPLNVAVAMARLGVEVTLATQLGLDEHGDLVRRHLEHSGVAMAVSPVDRTSSATARISTDGSAAYDFDLTWDPGSLPDPAGFDVVHAGSIAAWTAPGADAVADLAASARTAGVPVSFDPNVRGTLVDDVDALRRRVGQLVAAASVVKLSDEDAAYLAFDDQKPDDVLLAFSGYGPGLVAMTRGGVGSLLRSGEGEVVEAPSPVIRVADTIGAGDTYMGALLVGLLRRGWAGRRSFEPMELLWLGTVASDAAAITCSRPGADPPWAAELPVLGASASDPTDG